MRRLNEGDVVLVDGPVGIGVIKGVGEWAWNNHEHYWIHVDFPTLGTSAWFYQSDAEKVGHVE